LQQPPVGVGEPLEELAQFQVIPGHGADLWDQLLADILGAGFLIHLGGEMITALGRVLVEGTLEEVQAEADLSEELLFADPEDFIFFAHKHAYVYAHIMTENPPPCQGD
jgi:hypothetical protein